jgi:PAS domain S-box-containing protein
MESRGRSSSRRSRYVEPTIHGDRPHLEFQSLILGQVSDAVISIDNEGRVTYLNSAAERQYAVAAPTVIGRPLSDLYTYEWIDSGDEQIAWAALAHEGFWRGENRHVLRNGRVLHVESSVSVLHDAAGTRTGLLAVVRDVTASARSEAALQESSARNRMALDAADLGTWRFDVESGRVALDRRAREHYGVASRSVDISEIIARFHPDDAPGLQGAMEAAMDPAIRGSCRRRVPDREAGWIPALAVRQRRGPLRTAGRRRTPSPEHRHHPRHHGPEAHGGCAQERRSPQG